MLDSIKNISDIIFALVGSVVAVLTYRAAKETVLQPVRTEVIKKQTDLLIDVVTLIKDERSLMENIDYGGIISINTLGSLLLCGAIFSEHEEVREFVKINNKMEILTTEGANEYSLVSMFKEKEPSSNSHDNKKYYNDAKRGQFKISSIRLTQKFVEFKTHFEKLKQSPFIPIKILKLLGQLEIDIHKNILTHLKSAVEEAVNESFKREKDTTPDIDGVRNDFNHRRLFHNELTSIIYLETRKYLKIDTMP